MLLLLATNIYIVLLYIILLMDILIYILYIKYLVWALIINE